MGKAAQKCTKCKKHGVEKLVKLHKQYCPYRTCGCKICEDVDRKRSQRAEQTRIRRQRRTDQIVMEQLGLGNELHVSHSGGPILNSISKQEFEDSQSQHEYSRKFDGDACLRSGSPPAAPTLVSTSAATPTTQYRQLVSNVSPLLPSSASSANSSSPPPPPPQLHQSDKLPATSSVSNTAPPQSSPSPSPSPALSDDVPAYLWCLFSHLCWISFGQVAASEHHHVSRVLTNARNELMYMVHQYPANKRNYSGSNNILHRRSPPPPLPAVVSHHQHLYNPAAATTAPVYSTPHRHHHHHHHPHPYRWPTPPPPSHSPDNYLIPTPPPPAVGSDGSASRHPYTPPPSAALLYNANRSLSPTPLSGRPAYNEEIISQYIRHTHTVQRCEEHRRLYGGDERADYSPPTEQTR